MHWKKTKVTVKNSQKILFIKPLNQPKYSSLYLQKYFLCVELGFLPVLF